MQRYCDIDFDAGIGSSYLFRVDNDYVIDATKKVTYDPQHSRFRSFQITDLSCVRSAGGLLHRGTWHASLTTAASRIAMLRSLRLRTSRRLSFMPNETSALVRRLPTTTNSQSVRRIAVHRQSYARARNALTLCHGCIVRVKQINSLTLNVRLLWPQRT